MAVRTHVAQLGLVHQALDVRHLRQAANMVVMLMRKKEKDEVKKKRRKRRGRKKRRRSRTKR